MIEINIPGRGILNINNVVLDYNGTVAVDGVMSGKVKNYIRKLSKDLNIYILTADTYGNVKEQCKDLPVSVKTFPNGKAADFKRQFVKDIGGENTIAVGNGLNDVDMFKEAKLSIAVMGEEGCASYAVVYSNITAKSIYDVFEMILKKDRIRATLRD